MFGTVINTHSRCSRYFLSIPTSLNSPTRNLKGIHHWIAILFPIVYDFCISTRVFFQNKQTVSWNLFAFNINSIYPHQEYPKVMFYTLNILITIRAVDWDHKVRGNFTESKVILRESETIIFSATWSIVIYLILYLSIGLIWFSM